MTPQAPQAPKDAKDISSRDLSKDAQRDIAEPSGSPFPRSPSTDVRTGIPTGPQPFSPQRKGRSAGQTSSTPELPVSRETTLFTRIRIYSEAEMIERGIVQLPSHDGLATHDGLAEEERLDAQHSGQRQPQRVGQRVDQRTDRGSSTTASDRLTNASNLPTTSPGLPPSRLGLSAPRAPLGVNEVPAAPIVYEKLGRPLTLEEKALIAAHRAERFDLQGIDVSKFDPRFNFNAIDVNVFDSLLLCVCGFGLPFLGVNGASSLMGRIGEHVYEDHSDPTHPEDRAAQLIISDASTLARETEKAEKASTLEAAAVAREAAAAARTASRSGQTPRVATPATHPVAQTKAEAKAEHDAEVKAAHDAKK